MSSEDAKVRFIAGTVSPMGPDRHPLPRQEPLLPPDIRRVSAPIEIADYTKDGVEEAIAQRYWSCVDELMKQGAMSIMLSGLPISSQLGRPRVLGLLAETARKTGVTTDGHGEAAIAALRHFGASRIAIASRWSEQLNNAMVAYFAHGGIEVLAVTSAGQWAEQAGAMSIDEGVKLAFQLGREAMRRAPTAEALFLAGGHWRSLAAVPILEEDFGVPVITNPIAQAWRLIAAGIAPPVKGWGRLLAGA